MGQSPAPALAIARPTAIPHPMADANFVASVPSLERRLSRKLVMAPRYGSGWRWQRGTTPLHAGGDPRIVPAKTLRPRADGHFALVGIKSQILVAT